MIGMKFVHLTDTLESLLGILRDGILIRARRRNVWKFFTKRREFNDYEPQQFGMSCIHSYRFRPNRKCLDRFGRYGLELTHDWLEENDFRKVLYIKENGILHWAFQQKFDAALSELDEIMSNAPEDDLFPLMSFTNYNVAAWHGASKWCEFIERYQYMEPSKHKYQSEWRYARREPHYNQHSVEELKRDLKSRKGWTQILHLLKFSPDDVTRILLPKTAKHVRAIAFPSEYACKEIVYT